MTPVRIRGLGGASLSSFCIGASCGGIAQRFDDMVSQPILDFSMPRHRLAHPSDRIAVPVVLAAMSQQDTADRGFRFYGIFEQKTSSGRKEAGAIDEQAYQ
jgi:hypothetical protein